MNRMRTMTKAAATLFVAAILTAGGCATLPVPWYEELKTYPLIELGDPKPADGKYVVHLPAGKPMVLKVNVKGDLFREESIQEVEVFLQKDLYFFQDQMSFDMKRWERTRATLKFDWEVSIPSHKNPEPASIMLRVDQHE